MTIHDMYIKLNSETTSLVQNAALKSRLQAILLRLEALSESHGSDPIRDDIAKLVKNFKLCNDDLSKIEMYLNDVDKAIKSGISKILSKSNGNNIGVESKINIGKDFNLVEVITSIFTVVFSIGALIFLVLGLIDTINYDFIAFYITLGGAVISLVCRLIPVFMRRKTVNKDNNKATNETDGTTKSEGSNASVINQGCTVYKTINNYNGIINNYNGAQTEESSKKIEELNCQIEKLKQLIDTAQEQSVSDNEQIANLAEQLRVAEKQKNDTKKLLAASELEAIENGGRVYIPVHEYDDNIELEPLDKVVIPHKAKRSIRALYERAKKGDAKAQYDLGESYYSGKKVKRDYDEALKWFYRAAKQGNSDAQFMVGVCYINNKNEERGMMWYYRAAHNGNRRAQYNLACCYRMRAEADKDHFWWHSVEAEYAAYWFEKAAENGHHDAEFKIAEYYYGGIGVEEDYAKAVKYYKKCRFNGKYYYQCMDRIEKCYKYGGPGIKANPKLAKKYDRASAAMSRSFWLSIVGLVVFGIAMLLTIAAIVVQYTVPATNVEALLNILCGCLLIPGGGLWIAFAIICLIQRRRDDKLSFEIWTLVFGLISLLFGIGTLSYWIFQYVMFF